MAAKKYPLPKRFNAAISEKAYEKLRSLNKKFGYGNNYLLTILLENLDEFSDKKSLENVVRKFEEEYGAPVVADLEKGK